MEQVVEKPDDFDGIDLVELPLAQKDEYRFEVGTRSDESVRVCDNFRVRRVARV